MEEFDELVQAPDDSGVLDLSHRAWVTLDDAIWTWGTSLIVLNVSFNRVEKIPPGLGQLALLRELDVSNNHIEEIPAAIGECLRIRKLKCNGNRLHTLPKEIAKCKLLEEVYASENQMQILPSEIGKLTVLRILQCQNNKIKTIPPELGDLLSLDDVDFTNNPKIDNVPAQLLNDTPMIVWICRHNKMHRDQVEELSGANEELEYMSQLSEEEKIRMREEIEVLRHEKHKLEVERPIKYLKAKAVTTKYAKIICVIQ